MTLKNRLALVGALTVAAASFAPATIAGAQDESPAPESGSKTVIESETGSYIVVMAADPLIATIAADDLDTPAAEAQAAVLEESHDEVLADAGIDTADKVQDYTNSLNGFSACSATTRPPSSRPTRRSHSSCPTRCATRPPTRAASSSASRNAAGRTGAG